MDIKIAKDCYIPKEKVRFYCSADISFIRQYVRDAKKNGQRVIDLSGGRRPTLSIVVDDDWTIYKLNTSIATLSARMDPQEPMKNATVFSEKKISK